MKIISILFIIYLICINNSHLVYAQSTNYCEALKYSLLFYKAQRAGRLPDNDIPWRGNSVLKDTYNNKFDSNGDGILSKGYFDAGDAVKFGFPMAYSMTMLGWVYVTYKDNIVNCGLDSLYKDVLKWGSDYIIACHVEDNVFVGQIADGDLDHSFWVAPENLTYVRDSFAIDSSKTGTDLAMEAAAALSVTSMVFSSSDPTYSSNCLDHSKKLYNFAINNPKNVYQSSISNAGSFYSSGGYNDEIAWASVWLYKATNQQNYLDTAKTYFSYNDVQYAKELSWDQKGVPTGLLLLQITNDASYKSRVEEALNSWISGSYVTFTPGGLAYLRQWGPCRYAMSMALVAAVYGKSGDDYTKFAKSQLNYVLGDNPKKFSFVVGWGTNYPKNPHHRASHHPTDGIKNPAVNTYVLYGALVGGPKNDDVYDDNREDYVQSEVALDYNVGLVGTLAAFSAGSEPASKTNPYSGGPITNPGSGSNSGPNTGSNPDSNSDSDSDSINASISIRGYSSLLLIIYLIINVLLL
ncbi:hypothetical protein DICPUDRAFT_36716 [Dictyostelium purpureum]|uniref:Endoglucanase n=1 Tax=Dictyostelium purpureum TaxID=5786 RepID=F0ZRH6_DICPU|nr:uncharacterized protein DICPUDRAFT_36716 [Dictyostelium purpureum]EGC33455.1 hypothetical protein DICPUDRAFT_36716 [Dictyostelium purpureum]|eukprot:XP_003290026.1 hypothetical protein DICPUDRAFT_36716 [Dictyostelium purpureum]